MLSGPCTGRFRSSAICEKGRGSTGQCIPRPTGAGRLRSNCPSRHSPRPPGRGQKYYGWRTPSNAAVEVAARVAAGAPLVYAYYDGSARPPTNGASGPFYGAELRAVDRLVEELLAAVPEDVAVVVTADHGQVMVGDRVITPDRSVLALTRMQSGEGRSVGSTHGVERPGTCVPRPACHGTTWRGSCRASRPWTKAGSGAMPRRRSFAGTATWRFHREEPVSFDDPADGGPFQLIGRHGSLTEAGMLVPLIAARRQSSPSSWPVSARVTVDVEVQWSRCTEVPKTTERNWW
ncbi:MAG: alkaline phosphatase family protein [Ilumatobacteraceae bacterium]